MLLYCDVAIVSVLFVVSARLVMDMEDHVAPLRCHLRGVLVRRQHLSRPEGGSQSILAVSVVYRTLTMNLYVIHSIDYVYMHIYTYTCIYIHIYIYTYMCLH